MNRIIFSIALGFVATASFASCHRLRHTPQPNENTFSAVTENEAPAPNAAAGHTRTIGRIPRFEGVNVYNGITLRYVANGKPGIVVTTSRIAPSEVSVNVIDDDLVINYANQSSVQNEKTVITITGYSIKDFEAYNGGTIEVVNPLRAAGKLSFEVNNGGLIKLPGVKASELDFDVKNGGLIQANNINVSNIDLNVNTGGEIKVNGAKVGYAEVEVDNGGSISITGNASTGKFEINNGGKIRAEGLNTKRASVEVNNGGMLHYNTRQLMKHEVFGGQATNHFK